MADHRGNRRISYLMAHAAKPVPVAPPAPKHTFTEFTSIEYLKIDIAGHFGLDKSSFQERIQWTDDHLDDICLMLYEVESAEAEGRERMNTILDQAETPALFFAACNAWRQADAGKPISFPISLDATASGIQLLAIMAGCRKTAEICNVVPTGQRQDAYTHVYNRMGAALGAQGHHGRIQRTDIKKAMMTLGL